MTNDIQPNSEPSAGGSSKPPVKRSATIEIRRWDVMDIYYNEENYNEVRKIIDEYILQGWSEEGWDSAANKNYEGCVQLMRWKKPKRKRL